MPGDSREREPGDREFSSREIPVTWCVEMTASVAASSASVAASTAPVAASTAKNQGQEKEKRSKCSEESQDFLHLLLHRNEGSGLQGFPRHEGP